MCVAVTAAALGDTADREIDSKLEKGALCVFFFSARTKTTVGLQPIATSLGSEVVGT